MNKDAARPELPEKSQKGPVAITLPDGSVRNFDGPVTGLELATDIGAGLAKAALAIRVDSVLRDLSHVIDRDSTVAIVTAVTKTMHWTSSGTIRRISLPKRCRNSSPIRR